MRKILIWTLSAALICIILFAVRIIVFARTPILFSSSPSSPLSSLSPVTPIDFTIQPGSSLRLAVREMIDSGVKFSSWKFVVLARLVGKSGNIKAGSYEIEQGITPWLLLKKLTRGDMTQAELLVVEGWTFEQMRRALDKHPHVQHLTSGWSESALAQALGTNATSVEGLFFPDTYLFGKGTSDLEILKRAHRSLIKLISVEWRKRALNLPYTQPYEALIMASIIEKETGMSTDRPEIASVFINRLRKGMPLQTDPTVIYGLTKGLKGCVQGDANGCFNGVLHKQDLKADHIYNTYIRLGLPPTPIAMPGYASIYAALHPAKTNYLYFVSRGDGSSQFSVSLEEHNQAVAKYILKKVD